MLMSFSNQYWLGESPLDLYPGDIESPRINQTHYSKLYKHWYDKQEPILIKIDKEHMELQPASDVRGGSLEVPQGVFEYEGIEEPPTSEGILFAKPQAAKIRSQYDSSEHNVLIK